MAEYQYKYNYLPCPGHVTGHEFGSDYGLDHPAGIAGDAARHLYHEREHNSNWSHTLIIWELDGTLIGKFNVDCDDAPQFEVHEVTDGRAEEDQGVNDGHREALAARHERVPASIWELADAVRAKAGEE